MLSAWSRAWPHTGHTRILCSAWTRCKLRQNHGADDWWLAQPGQPVASQECACKFLLLVWLLQSCAGCAGPGSGGKDARSADEGHMCPVHRPVHPCQQQAQGKANGTQLVAAVTTSLLFILGIQQHPAAAWTTSQQHDTGAQGVGLVWLDRTHRGRWRGYAASPVVIRRSLTMWWPGSGPGVSQSEASNQSDWPIIGSAPGSVFTLTRVTRVSSLGSEERVLWVPSPDLTIRN